MIDIRIAKQWEKNKKEFEFIIHRAVIKGNFVFEYRNLLTQIIKYIINLNLPEENEEDYSTDNKLKPLDEADIEVVTLGGWNGDYLFIIKPKDKFASVPDIWVTKVFYGSCSGCDMMLDAESRLDPREKTRLLMKLSLEILEEFRSMSLIYPI